jgi:hypothetical protein
MKLFSSKLVVTAPQACRPSNSEVAVKQLAPTERPSFKHRANCSLNIIRQGPSGLGSSPRGRDRRNRKMGETYPIQPAHFIMSDRGIIKTSEDLKDFKNFQ